MYDTESRQAALAIEGVNGETEDIDIVELLLKTLGKGEILPYGIGNIVVIELANSMSDTRTLVCRSAGWANVRFLA